MTSPRSITKTTTLGSQFVIISHATEGLNLSKTDPFLKGLNRIQTDLSAVKRLRSEVLLVETKNSKPSVKSTESENARKSTPIFKS